MTSAVWPILLTVFTWWFTTGVILYLDGLDRSFSRAVLGGFTDHPRRLFGRCVADQLTGHAG
jgi:hypothetical protein